MMSLTERLREQAKILEEAHRQLPLLPADLQRAKDFREAAQAIAKAEAAMTFNTEGSLVRDGKEWLLLSHKTLHDIHRWLTKYGTPPQ